MERLDKLAALVGATAKRSVSRAALMRALLRVGVDLPSPNLARILEADPVRRGRLPGWNGGAS